MKKEEESSEFFKKKKKTAGLPKVPLFRYARPFFFGEGGDALLS